jgi:NTE family protein
VPSPFISAVCARSNGAGLLDRVVVLSTVSGGSVIGAYFIAHRGDFASFEANVRAALARGLVAPMRRRLFSALGLKVVAAFILVGSGALGVALIKMIFKILSLATPRSLAIQFEQLRN